MPSESIGVIAQRYASALFDLAESRDILDAVAADLETLKAMIGDSADLRRLLHSPAVSRADQTKAVTTLAAKAGFDTVTSNFLGLAAQHRRLILLPAVIESYLGRLAARRGETAASVATAVALSPAQIETLTATLKAAFGGAVAVEAAVDPSLLGGMVVKVGSRMVDSSLRTKLQHLKLAMKGIG